MTTPGWTPEDAEALRRLQERQQAAAQPAAGPDELPADEAAAEPAGAASFPEADSAGAEDGAGDVVPAPEPAGDAGPEPEPAGVSPEPEVADGPAVDGGPDAGPADQGPAEAVGPAQFEVAEPGPEGDQPIMPATAAEAQQSLSAAGAAALPDYMHQSEAVSNGEPALPDEATSN